MSARRSSEESQNLRITPTETLPSPERYPPHSPFTSIISTDARSSTSSTKNEGMCDWEGRENEKLVFESKSKVKSCEYTSHSRILQQETIDQAECRVFELLYNEHSMPTRRLVMRNRESPQDFVSYCKPSYTLTLLF
jgi:hypothetical protein